MDPFAGRGSSVFASSVLGRKGVGIEINPVGWLYGKTKLCPASENLVFKSLGKVLKQSRGAQAYRDEFFKLCYSQSVFDFLITARKILKWKTRKADATLMSLILVYLHGKEWDSFSNQMRQGKALSPDYSIRWWKSKGKTPPHIDVMKFLAQRIKWRYSKGIIKDKNSQMLLGDSTKLLKRVARFSGPKVGLLFTSPPYYEVTNYHYDQWLRLWMLGGFKRPRSLDNHWARKFSSKEDYKVLLQTVFENSAKLLKKNANIYVRTDARPFTFQTTKEILKDIFPKKKMKILKRPFSGPTQTALFGDKSPKPGEMDIILSN